MKLKMSQEVVSLVDYLLSWQVNGEDVLGMRVSEVANLVKSKIDRVSLLLWNTNLDGACESNLCCGPMPLNYEKLAATVQTILTAIECPVCFNTITSPFTQCQNGHLLCLRCRARSDKCPICRDRYSVVRCLLAEQVIKSFLCMTSETTQHLPNSDRFTRRCSRRSICKTAHRAKFVRKSLAPKLAGRSSGRRMKRPPRQINRTRIRKSFWRKSWARRRRWRA